MALRRTGKMPVPRQDAALFSCLAPPPYNSFAVGLAGQAGMPFSDAACSR